MAYQTFPAGGGDSSGSWRNGAIAFVLLLGVGFACWRIYQSFQDEIPSWLLTREKVGPRLGAEAFQPLLMEIERQARERNLPVRTVRFIGVAKDCKETYHWTLESLTNPGYAPMVELEKIAPAKQSEFVGYYALDGTPIPYMQKRDPNRPQNLSLKLHLSMPILPGTTQLVFCVVKKSDQIKKDKAGFLLVNLGKFRGEGIQGLGISLPKGVICKSYSPEQGAMVSSNSTWSAGWCNVLLETNAPGVWAAFVPR